MSLNRGTFLGLSVVVLALALWVRSVGIGEFGLRLDETFHFQTAIGYLRSGEFRLWEFGRRTVGEYYHRAFLYTWQVAILFGWLGVDLGVGRFVSLGWGMFLFVPVLWMGYRLNLSRFWLIWLGISLTVFPYAVTTSRWLRLYAMYAVLFLGLVILLYELLVRSGWRLRLLLGVGSLPVGAAALETHLLSLSLIPSVIGFLWHEHLRTDDGNQKLVNKQMLMGLTGLLILITLISIGFFHSKILAEVSGGITLSWNYPVLLYRDLFGYGFGTLAFLATMVLTGRTRFERYLWWVVAVPVLLLVFATDRLIQYRYAGHLTVLMLPVFALTAQRAVVTLSNRKSKSVVLVVGLLVLFSPVVQLEQRLKYIHDGNFSYVQYPGQRSPKYRPVVETLESVLSEGDQVVTVFLYDYYRSRLSATGATVDNVTRDFATEIPRTLRQSAGRDQWVLIPTHARNDLPPVLFDRFRNDFEELVPSGTYNIHVFHRRGEEGTEE